VVPDYDALWRYPGRRRYSVLAGATVSARDFPPLCWCTSRGVSRDCLTPAKVTTLYAVQKRYCQPPPLFCFPKTEPMAN
jgi:hypothetical protein